MKAIMILSSAVLMAVALPAADGLCDSAARPFPRSPTRSGDEPRLTRTVFLSGLSDPWDLAFTPDGAMLFTEKCRGLSVRRADGSVHRLFGTKGSSVEAGDFFCRGQSGMHGVAVDPDFVRNRFVYVYMPSKLGSPATNRVIRLTVDTGYSRVSNRRDIVTDIPFKNSFNRWGGEGAHSGGRIRFGPSDGFLYVTTGDNHNGPLPQGLKSLGGKILRMDRNGAAAPGNKTPSGGDPRIFTYGHRNVQGIAFHPESGRPYSCEHGPGRDDEVTPLFSGGNGGWDPKPEPGVDCASNYCGYISNKLDGTPTPMTDTGMFPDAMRPSWANNGVSEGMSPCVFLSGELELKPCNGCMRCVFQQRDCVIPDRFSEVYEALRWADAVVLGAPTYVLAPNSVQKNLQDRLIRMGQSHEMRGKLGVAIATAGVPGWEALALPLVTQALLFMGIEVVDRFVALAQGPGEILDNSGALERADRAGRALALGEKTYLGEPALCPICNLDVVTVAGPGRGTCKICEIPGTVDAEGVFTPDAGSRARHAKEAVDHHFNVNVLPSGPRFMEKVRDYRARAADFHKGFED